MKNPFASLIHFVVQSLRTTFRIRPEQPLRPSRARLSRAKSRDQQAVKEFRSMVLDMFSDPETLRLLLPHLVTAFPIQGGMPAENYICKFNAAGNPVDTATPIFEKDGNKIGIGTTGPQTRLHVADSSSGALEALRLNNTNDGAAADEDVELVFSLGSVSGGNPMARILGANKTNGTLSNGYLSFWTRNADVLAEKMRIDNVGNVGIGTTTPQEKLHVSIPSGNVTTLVETGSGGAAGVRSKSSNRTWQAGVGVGGANLSAWNLYDETGAATRLTVDTSGNVGIGTTSPTEKLDVAGNILCQGLNKIVFLKPLGGTSDDKPQIQAAIDNLPSDGGIIVFTPGTYRIGSKISVSKSGVKLRGYGGAWRDDGFHLTVSGSGKTVNNTGANPLTKLLWTGSGDDPVVELKPSTANMQIQDLELADLSIDGGGVQGSSTSGAKFGLVLNRVTNSRFKRVEVRNMRDATGSVGIKLTTDGTAFGMNTDWNLFDRCTVLLASECVYVTAESSAVDSNSCHNTFIGLTCSYWSTSTSNVGVRLGTCDNNAFYDTFIFQHNLPFPNLGNGRGVVVDDPLIGASNYFYHLQAVGGGLVKNVNTGNLPGDKNMIFGYDQANGGIEPDPTAQNASGSSVDPELVLFWTDSKVKMRGLSSLSTTGGITVGSGGSQGVNAGSYAIGGTTVLTTDRDLGNLRDVTVAGSGRNLGFYGSTPQAKQSITGSRGDPEQALKNLLSALNLLGLITDSSTS